MHWNYSNNTMTLPQLDEKMYKDPLTFHQQSSFPHPHYEQSNMSSGDTSPIYNYNSHLQSPYVPPSHS